MQAQQHTWLEKMFDKSNIKNMAFNADIPVLIIPVEKKQAANEKLTETLHENV